MKTIKPIALMCIVMLCTSLFNMVTAMAPLTTNDCGCTNNVLTNPSFEDNDTFKGWTKSGSWDSNTTYDVCGSKAVVLRNAGSLSQDVQVMPGTVAKFAVWGGYHAKFGQTFNLIFLDIKGTALLTKSVAVDWDVDKAPSNGPILKKYNLEGTAPEGTVTVRVSATSGAGDWFKIDGACLQLTAPVVNCNCDDNVLKNAGFEDDLTSWQKTSAGVNTDWKVCGNKAGVVNGTGNLYQDIAVIPGTKVDYSVYGGYHNPAGQVFKLSFYKTGSNTPLSTKSVAVDWNVDDRAPGQPKLKQYFLSAEAPANTNFVRIEAASSGDYLKVDAACVRLTVPPVSCCTTNMLSNGSFEDFTTVSNRKVPTNWKYSEGANFSWDGGYPVCGNQNGLLTGSGSFYQDVLITGGSTATLSVWGGYHAKSAHTFKLQFVMPDGTVKEGVSKLLDKSVDDFPRTSNTGMTQYTLTAVAPAGAKYVRVFGSATGDYFKVDAACLTISVPVCETCNDNKLLNPNFENGTADWTKVVGSFETSEDYVVCGTKSGKLVGKSTIAQEKAADPGSSVTFSIYAGVNVVNGQKLRLRFLNTDRGEISIKETLVTKIYSAATVGLAKYTVSERAPQNTKYVSVELVSNGETFIFDLGCLSIVGGTPLPVTLTEFGVKKEGNSASLVWKTTMETNSKEFEVQHSLNGKQWEILGVVAAEGESSVIKTYSYTHTTPSNGSNLYRLRMIDNDLTFAYSRIVTESFVTEESAVLYPNPSSNFMKLKSGVEKIASIQIYDVRGIKVRDFTPGSNDIDISSLDQGTYIVTFKQLSGLVTKQRIQVVR